MRYLFLASLAAGLLCGCVSRDEDVWETLDRSEQVSYFDRNGDGRVDLERHAFPGVADADWELRDDGYDGRYETKILYGFTKTRAGVDLATPTGVKIEDSP